MTAFTRPSMPALSFATGLWCLFVVAVSSGCGNQDNPGKASDQVIQQLRAENEALREQLAVAQAKLEAAVSAKTAAPPQKDAQKDPPKAEHSGGD